MSETFRPPAGEPSRPLPPYRPVGPQAGPPGAAPAGQRVFSPIPSQSTAGAPPAPHGAPAGYGAQPQPVTAAELASFAQPAPLAAPGAAYQSGPVQPEFSTPGGGVPAQGRPVASAVPAGAVPSGAVPPHGTTTFVPQPAGAPVVPPAAMPGAPGHVPATSAPAAPSTVKAPPTRDRAARSGMGQERHEDDVLIDDILTQMVKLGASDVHLTTGAPPTVRVSGSLRPLDGFAPLSPEPLRRVLYAILTQKQRETFETNLELDFSYAVRGLARFRVNIYQQRESIGAAFRVIPYEIKPLEELGVPAVVGTFAGLPRGLVLVTGPTGSGKSTTLASIVDLANRTREDHIMTVEDPIEFLHRHKKSLVNQREVGEDTHSFANALKHVLRQDPDIILVGEMRDLETISVALTAAETGHLVFATLHTQDAAQTIDRVIDVFPSHQQAQVRTQLAGAIQGVVCQTLCKRSDAPGRAVATEVMVATPAIRNLIREGKTHQIYSAMQAGAKQGMHTMDQHLAELVKTGKISYELGLEKCHHVEDCNRLTGRFSGSSQGAAGLGDEAVMGAGAYGQAF
ncbi:twitching motility protein [Cellulomonas fimi ATCC 484]|uniref:Twitching motility protein n=2 Tax=Cellulomonas fimi TaxID=1708 RepID=F4H089_CELFA|nr:twitching motility protein [Cellulomonas fimi ATCC 484]VEH31775.1 Twitching mobility protein [Cellulomonas fimi]